MNEQRNRALVVREVKLERHPESPPNIKVNLAEVETPNSSENSQTRPMPIKKMKQAEIRMEL